MYVGLKVPSLVQGKNTFSKWQKLVPPKVTFSSTAVPTYAFLHSSPFCSGVFAFTSNQNRFLAVGTLKGRGTGREQVLTTRVEPWKGFMRSFKQNFVLTVHGMGFSLFKILAGYNRM